MVFGWRRAFCTSIPKNQERESTNQPIIKDKSDPSPSPTPKLTSRIGGLFSNPSTPRLGCRTAVTPPPNAVVRSNSAPQSPKLQCKTKYSSRFFHTRSTPSSPRSPSTFSLVKSSLRLSKSRCGICLQSVKTGQGTAIFTAECGHSFHFPCIAVHVKKQCTLTCPICNSTWKEMHLLNIHQNQTENGLGFNNDKRCVLKVYNDDEPLSSPTSGARFNSIPESDETEEKSRNVEVALMSETAVISVGKTSETYVVVLKIKAPASPLRRAPIDLVTVLNVSKGVTAEKMQLMKKSMRLVVSSLSTADRLSIVAYSTTSKRLLPLRRMSTSGRRAARRIIDAMVTLDIESITAISANDSLKKAAKVLEDRREINPAASIILFSDGNRTGPLVITTRSSTPEIPVHSVNLSACINAPHDDSVTKRITGLLNVVMQNFKIGLGFTSSDSPPCEISAVYNYAGTPAFLGSGSSWCRVGEFYSEEERELLIELKVPSSYGGAHRLLTVRCCYKDPSNQQLVYDKERHLSIPRSRAIGSSSQRLKCIFLTTRAVAESRRLIGRNDVVGAHHMLVSARALVLQSGSGSGSGSGSECVRGLEAELAELRRRNNHDREAATVGAEEKAEPLTPTSAWRAAERLAKVAIMKKSLNRVSDLHGFENARF